MLDSVRVEYSQMQLGRAAGHGLLLLILLPFWLVGWIVGFIWRCIVWIAAAFVAGWKAGAGDALRKSEGNQ